MAHLVNVKGHDNLRGVLGATLRKKKVLSRRPIGVVGGKVTFATTRLRRASAASAWRPEIVLICISYDET